MVLPLIFFRFSQSKGIIKQKCVLVESALLYFFVTLKTSLGQHFK